MSISAGTPVKQGENTGTLKADVKDESSFVIEAASGVSFVTNLDFTLTNEDEEITIDAGGITSIVKSATATKIAKTDIISGSSTKSGAIQKYGEMPDWDTSQLTNTVW